MIDERPLEFETPMLALGLIYAASLTTALIGLMGLLS